jgi:hypothetical protein
MPDNNESAISYENSGERFDPIRDRIGDFQGIKSNLFRSIMYHLPISLFIIVIFIIISTRDLYIMYATLILAVAITIMVFQILMNSIPGALYALWCQGIIGEKMAEEKSKRKSGVKETVSRDNDDNSRLQEQYLDFITEFEDALSNFSGQYILALVFSFILVARSLFEFWKWLPSEFWTGLIYKAGGLDALFEGIKLHLIVYLTEYPAEEPLKFWLGLTFEPFLGFVLGMVAWRMISTGRYIGELRIRFDINPRLENPDRCGGLEPLGNLSLLNACIVSVWGIFLGGWIIIGSGTKYGNYYSYMYLILSTLPIVMAVATFILPLWGVHEVMAQKKKALEDDLYQLALHIHEMAKEKLERISRQKVDNTNWESNIAAAKKTYQEIKNFPTWPFNYRILIAFITTQAVPLLSLTGLGAPMVNSIGSLINFLGQFGSN